MNKTREQWTDLDQQAEPVEPAPAQDERTAFEAWVMQHNTAVREDYDDTDENAPEDIRLDRQGGVYIWANAEAAWFAWKARSALDTRPAQTEQQPVAWRDDVGTLYPTSVSVEKYLPPERTASPLYAAPAPAPAPQPEPEQEPEQEPFWYAVVSEQAPSINSAIRRLDVAQEFADSKRERWPDTRVVPLYAPPCQPKEKAMSDELKPCPFCNREAQRTESSGLVSCAFDECPAFLLAVPADNWNRRAQPAEAEGVDRQGMIESMCLTWRHDFGLDAPAPGSLASGMTERGRQHLRGQMRELFDHHFAPALSAVTAERDRLQGEIQSLRGSMEFRSSLIGRTEAERDQLRTEVEALRTDALIDGEAPAMDAKEE